jgi:VanZ family protein
LFPRPVCRNLKDYEADSVIKLPSPKIVAILWAAALLAVVVGELLPGDSTPMQLVEAAEISDKVLHLVAYAVLAILPAAGFRAMTAVWCLVGVECLGLVLECLQPLVPGRSFELGDIAANTLGLIAGALAAVVLRRLART